MLLVFILRSEVSQRVLSRVVTRFAFYGISLVSCWGQTEWDDGKSREIIRRLLQ